ncbi:putative U3 small nucleolar ribonucleoprotein Lcp5 [Penicillium brasilianum]|uniref:Putative U3 small nucleolar ribonucleoprotein Lcp5 n=1 Tax=Penicillium brasilianum TaxID=104259 RepID=A0A1S9RPQ3_PENBI|nr:putative U3 small nucleolar ribonucleoprotein Lcp5 [Penicillium brasilianum]
MASAETAPVRAQNLSALLESLTSCLISTSSSLPAVEKDASTDVSITPPQDGISLLDTKSEILLSYLQNLVFLIIFQLRQTNSKELENSADSALRDEAVNKLVELRVFLDRGVRPLEGRLKYQIDKVIKAAEESERTERPAKSKKPKKASKTVGSGSEDESEDDDQDSNSEEDSDEEDEEDEEEDMDEMAYRPNVAALAKGKVEQKQPQAKATRQEPSDGIYRPPKIMPTALPTTESRERRDRRPIRSNVIDEFVSAEMSAAPMAEPSIGSTIIAGGRQTKSKKDREHEAERTRYEETNFVRLPKETKKDLAKRGGGRGEATYGGDEWKGLTEGADRIERLTRRSKNSGSALEKSRKRKNEDGQRSDGVAVGDIFDKRRKKIDSWKR